MSGRETRNGAASVPAFELEARARDHIELQLGGLAELIAALVVDRLADLQPASSAGYRDVQGAADYLACDARRIYDLVGSGRLRCSRDGRRLLFTEDDLRGCLDTDIPAGSGSGSAIEGRPATARVEGRRGGA